MLALLAVDTLGVGFLGAFERRRGAQLLGLLFTGAAFSAGAGVAGVVVCAKAELIKNGDAKAATAAREERVIMGHLRLKRRQGCAAMLNRG